MLMPLMTNPAIAGVAKGLGFGLAGKSVSYHAKVCDMTDFLVKQRMPGMANALDGWVFRLFFSLFIS